MKRLFLALTIILSSSSCDVLREIAQDASQVAGPPTESEISAGIKEALLVGIKNAVMSSAQDNGFFKNELIKIPFPPEAQKVEKTLRDIGLDPMVDQFVETLNHGAEKAAKKATPIFTQAITNMTLKDVYAIWKGDDDAATQYLKRSTSDQLREAFRPEIKRALQQVEVSKYWNPIASTYNKIPFVSRINPNLEDYVLEQTLEGLFKLTALEEAKIRQNPTARVSAILKRVFGWES